MWRVVLTVVLWNTISSQPVTDDLQNRPAQQLDHIECCPCPGSSRASLPDLDKAASIDTQLRAAVDDCPCRLQDDDSQGSPSVFLPRTVRPARPFVTPDASKEDVKPLLKPEVGLASSVLETLREVTDEEYKDALERDAARNAARVAELGDSQPDTAKNIVTIIVNPREGDARDAIPEASQAFESHCVPPSGATNPEQVFKLQPSLLSRNVLLDLDNAASEVQQNIVSFSKGLEGLKLKTAPSLLKLFPPRKLDGGNIQSLLKLKNNKLPKNAEGVPRELNGSLKPKLPSFKLPSLFRKNENTTSVRPLGLGLKKKNTSKIRTSSARKPQNDLFGNDDSNPSPSIIQEQFSEATTTPPFSLKSLFPAFDVKKTPINLKNLLNLKDVELIPPKPPKIVLPDLKLLPFLRVNKSKTTFTKQRKSERLVSKNCKSEAEENNEDLNEQQNQRVHTAILDAIPHASENSEMAIVNDIETTENTNIVQKDENIKTEILDTVPDASDFNEMFVANDNLVETSTPKEGTTDSNGDLEPQHFDEGITDAAAANNLSKGNVEKLDHNLDSVELFIDQSGNSRFEELDLFSENDQPVNEIEINSSTLNMEGQELDLEINEDSERPSPVTSNFNTNDDMPILIEEDNEEVGEFESIPEENQGVNAFEIEEGNRFEPAKDNQEISSFEPVQEIQDVNGFELKPREETEQIEGIDIEPVQEIGESDITINVDGFFDEISHKSDAEAELSNQNIQIPSPDLGIDIEPVQEIGESDITINVDGFFDEISHKKDAEAEPSNQNIQIPSPDFFEESNVLMKTREDLPSQEQESGLVPEVTPLSLKEKILLRLNSIKNPKTKITISSITHPETFERNIEETSRNSLNSDELAEVESLTEDTEQFPAKEKSAKITKSETSDVNMEDLQNKSNSLLQESERKRMLQPKAGSNEKLKKKSTISSDVRSDSAMLLKSEILKKSDKKGNDEINSDMDSSATSLKENVHAHSVSDDINNRRADITNSELSTEVKLDNTCPSNLQLVKSKSGGVEDTGVAEMAPAASEMMFNTIPKSRSPSSPLLQSIVVQPSSLFPPIAPLDLSSVTLPTLDDIRVGISNILGGSARAADDEDTLTNFDSGEDCADSNPLMSSDASTTNAKSTVPLLKPLEDINLDIFQINPQSNRLLQSRLPSLNLNSFRTKLALPKSAGLKPLKLQSSLGRKNGGLLGATLTFGRDKMSSRKAKPIPKLGSILNLQGTEILRNPLPSLEDLRSTMRANTQSVLKSPLVNPFDDTLRTTKAFTDSLRSHTENTMRNIHKSLSSTLKEANNAGEKFAKPQNFLETMSSAHEDVKDKLYGIHVDLQDRLQSLHDNILDQSKSQIPILQMPLFGTFGRLQDVPFTNSNARSNLKKTPQPKLIINKKNPTTARVNKLKSKLKEQNIVKPFKLSKAASSLTPKIVEVPKLMATSSKPPFLRPLYRDESVKLKETGPIFSNNQKKMPSKNKLKPFGIQTKVTIATTPLPTTFQHRPASKPLFGAKSIPIRTGKPTQFPNQRVGQTRSSSDLRGFPSEPKPMKVSAPVREREELISSPELSIWNAENNNEKLRASSPVSSSSSLPKFSLSIPLISRTHLPTLRPVSPIKLTSSKSSSRLLSLPKPTESPLVSKMREAIRIRFSHPVQTKEKLRTEALGSKGIGAEDMAKSASENKSVSLKTEPMKENVSYKCKMVCVKEVH